MTALAKNIINAHRERGLLSIPVGASVQIFKGAMVAVNAAGYAIPMADTAGLKMAGVADAEADNSSGSNGDINVLVHRGKVWRVVCASATQAWKGQNVYAVDDQTVGLFDTPTNNILVGIVHTFQSATQVWIETLPAETNQALGLEDTLILTADTTLLASDSGKTFFLDSIGEAITLPAPVKGLVYDFVVNEAPATSDWTIVATGALVDGCVTEAGLVQLLAGETTLTIAFANALKGDNLKLRSDGVRWFASGQFSVAASFTTA